MKALRLLPEESRPQRVYGCEVCRDLDWLCDERKTLLPVNRQDDLAQGLLEVFASQISGGKRDDRATLGRRLADATFHDAHNVDELEAATVAVDLTPVIQDSGPPLEEFTEGLVNDFKADVSRRLQKYQLPE